MMNWETEDALDDDSTTIEKKCHRFIFREMFIYHYEQEGVRIPIYPVTEEICCCNYHTRTFYSPYQDINVQFSQDSRLLAYYYKDSIYIVRTSDGSLLKRFFLGRQFSMHINNILFVSESHVLVCDSMFLFVFNVKTNDIEHAICLSQNDEVHFLPFSKIEGEPLTLIATNKFPPDKISQIVFHNLVLENNR
jgi:hypothetical protein